MTTAWWPILSGAVGGLVLGLALLGSFIFLRRTRIASQQEKQALLLAGEHKYSHLFNTVSDVVYMHEVGGKILEVNETIAQLLGVGLDQIVGHNIIDLVGSRHRNAVEGYLQQFADGATEVAGILPIAAAAKSTLLVLEFRSSLVAQGNRAFHVQGIARNVTEQTRYERSLKRREQQMQRLLARAEVMRENLSMVTREMLKVQEDERRRISRELHDEIGQLLATMTLNLELMKKSVASDDMALLKKRIGDTESLAGEMFIRIKTFLRELRPIALDNGGLVPAIKLLLKDYSDQTGIHAILADMPPQIDSLNYEKQAVLYRIMQEGLTNVAKHSHASTVEIQIVASNGDILLSVVDDGDGFETSPSPMPLRYGHGLGLLGMQERLNLIHGKFSVESKVGEGTKIQATIPIATE